MKTIPKSILAFSKVCSKNATRPILNTIKITEDKFVGTNSFILLELNYEGLNVDDFPKGGAVPVRNIEKPILLDAHKISKHVKFPSSNTLEILGQALLCNETNDWVSLMTNDLEVIREIKFRKHEGEFPDYEKILPVDEGRDSFSFDVNMMKDLCEALILAGKKNVKLRVKDEHSGVLIHGDGFRSLIMPLRN